MRRRLPLVLAVVVSAWLLWGLATAVRDDAHLSRSGVRVTATVTEVDRGRTVQSARLRFHTTAGPTDEWLPTGFELPTHGPLDPGERVDIDYDPGDPASLRRADDHGGIAEAVLLLIAWTGVLWVIRRAVRERARPPRNTTGRHA